MEAAFIYIAAVAAGVAVGILTGVLPALHVNLAAVFVASFISGSVGLADSASVVAAAVFILAMSISHVFHEFLPSVFLGFAESDAALAVLPGHRMLLRGEGKKAVLLAALGALAGVVALVILSPLLLQILKPAFESTKSHIGLILAAVIAFQLFRSRSVGSAAINSVTLMLSGLLGIAVFALPNLKEPLLPMLSGLFGVSSLISGLLHKPSIPQQQKEATVKVKNVPRLVKLLAIGIFSSSLMGLFPALGPAQAAMLGTAAIRRIKASAYMFLLGVISSASMLFAVLTLYSFGKARNGSIAVMGDMIGITGNTAILLLLAAVVAAALSCISVISISGLFTAAALKMNYRLVCWAVIAFVAVLVGILSGTAGLAVLSVAAAIGLIPILARTSRQLLMGCLMVPVIGYYL